MENKNYKHFDYGFRTDDPYALAKYRIIMKWLPLVDNLRVLNAGCGSGEMSAILALHNQTWQVDAIDVDFKGLELSRQIKRDYELENLTIQHSSIEEYQPEHTYDIIVSNDVLEHIEDDQTAIKHLRRLLATNGTLCISVPALQCLFGYHDENLGHFRRYNRRLLKQRLGQELVIQKCRYYGALFIPLALYYSRIRNQPYPLDTQRNKKSLAARIVGIVLQVEEHIPFPLGTSLLALATTQSVLPESTQQNDSV